MKSQEVYIALEDKCNKLSTNGNSQIYAHVAVRAIKEAMYYWYDYRLKQAEKDLTLQREVSRFIETSPLELIEQFDIYNSYKLPKNYYHMNQLRILGIKGKCKHYLDALWIENNNSQQYYLNDNFTPDFEWQQTLATLKKDEINIYKKDFNIEGTLEYYRKLKNFDIASDYIHLDGTVSKNEDLEFDNSDAFEIINLAAQLISGNVTDPQYQVHMNNVKQFE